MSDSQLLKQLKGSLFLVRRQRELEARVVDRSLSREERLEAAYDAIGVRQELSWRREDEQ